MAVIVPPAAVHLPLVAAYLDARMAQAEAMLVRTLDGKGDHIADPTRPLAEAAAAAAAAGLLLPDQQLARRYHLAPSTLDLLWLIAAPAIDPTVGALLRRFEGGPRDWVDPVIAARALAASRAARMAVYADLEPGAPLRAAQLIRAAAGEPLARRELQPATWLPAALRGQRAVGGRLDGLATLLSPSITPAEVPLPDRAEELAVVLRGLVVAAPEPRFAAAGLDHPRGVAVVVEGRAGSGRGVLVRALAGQLGQRLLVLDAARLRGASLALIADAVDSAAAEAAACDEWLVIANAHEWVMAVGGGGGSSTAALVGRALAGHGVVAVLMVLDDAPLAPEVERVVVFRHQHHLRPQAVDASHLWLVNLPSTAELDGELDLETFARSIHLTPAQVSAAGRAAVAVAGPGQPLTWPILDAAARAQITQGIGGLAEMSASTVSLDDLILRPDTRGQLEQIISAAKNRDLVLRRWGLRRTIKRGLSISCLFDGTPGTGKTLAAEVIAHELGLTLLRINVASIVDKYIGETEKNLTRIFEQARPDTTMLLFDEADSLFTKRTEVQHASDRFSNMNVNVLLQLIERFEGTAVLTTNLKKGLDTAFERRITFKVHFERPDPDERAQIWRLMLPPSVPTAERIDYDRLAKLDLSGGEIKNSVLRAAYAAAREQTEIRMRHLTAAAAEEAATSGRVYLEGAST